jgi:hypothetical protein
MIRYSLLYLVLMKQKVWCFPGEDTEERQGGWKKYNWSQDVKSILVVK